MKLAALSAPLLLKLLQLDRHAERLGELAEQAEEELAFSRAYLNGKREDPAVNIDALREGFDVVLAKAKRLRAAADAEQKVLSGAKLFLELLPPDSELAMVETAVEGLQLDAVRARKQAVADEIRLLRSVPVPSTDVKARIESYVEQLGRSGRPEVIGGVAGGELRVKWPDDFATNALLMAAHLFPERMTEALMASVDVATSKPLPVPQRLEKIRALEAEQSELVRVEVALVDQAISDGIDEVHDINAPPEVILGCCVVTAKASAAA